MKPREYNFELAKILGLENPEFYAKNLTFPSLSFEEGKTFPLEGTVELWCQLTPTDAPRRFLVSLGTDGYDLSLVNVLEFAALCRLGGKLPSANIRSALRCFPDSLRLIQENLP